MLVGQVVECPFIEVAAGRGHEGNRDVETSNLTMKGCRMPGGRLFKIWVMRCITSIWPTRDIGAPVEPDLHRADALFGEGLHMFDVEAELTAFTNG